MTSTTPPIETTSSESKEPGQNGDEQSAAGYEELAEHLREIEGISDDLAELIARNWTKFVGLFFVVILTIWVVGEWRTSEAKRNQELASRFSQAQASLSSYFSGDKKPSDLTAAQGTLRDFTVSAKDGVYKDLGGLYLAASYLEASNFSDAKDALKKYDVDFYNKFSQPAPISAAFSEKELVRELASLLYARVLLAESKGVASPELLNRLKGISFGTEIVNLQALTILARISSDSEAQKTVIDVGRKLLSARPTMADTVRQELSAVGINLE